MTDYLSLTPSDKITIVVVDDHPFFRQGVVDALSLEADLVVVGQAADGGEGLNLVRKFLPDLAIVDVNLPGMNGQQVVRQIVAEHLGAKVILLTAYDDPEQRTHAMRGGAAAYCSKDVEPGKLVEIIRGVLAGKFFMGERMMDALEIDRWMNAQTESAIRPYGDPGEPFHPLSSREMEVLVFVTRGKSNKEIATALKISHQTVKNHVTAILRKLGVEDRTQAAIFALRRGWVRLQQPNAKPEEE